MSIQTCVRDTIAATRTAPELFDVDDYGSASEIGDGEVPPELVEKARLAVANCPAHAITIDG